MASTVRRRLQERDNGSHKAYRVMYWRLYVDDTAITGVCLFVCIEVLRPSQPDGVMLSAVSLPNHAFTGQA